MPGLDGTGPQGEGPRTGQGTGQCRRPKTDDEQQARVEATGVEDAEAQSSWTPARRRIRRRGQGGGRGRGRRRGQRRGQGAGNS
jgi:hypothetical protein